MKEKVLKQLQDLIRDYTGRDDLVISKDSSLINDLELSSLDIISLVGSVEDTFEIMIDDEDIVNLLTVRDVVDYIVSKKRSIRR